MDNIFEFPRGAKVDDEQKPSKEATTVRANLEEALVSTGEDLRSLLYVIKDKNGQTVVGYGGEFSTTDIVGILETIKIELTIRAMMAAKE